MIKSIENFHNFFETIDDLIFIIDHTGKIMHTNRAVIEKLGYNEYELSGFTIYKLYSSSKQKKLPTYLIVCYPKTKTMFNSFIKKDGSKLPVESKIWYGTWNNQNCFYIISKDLSIQASALDKFYKIFSCSPALTAINTIGNNNNFVDINNSFIENLGYSRKK